MSALDDLRKLFQDLIAPELRAVVTRIDSLEKRLNERIGALDRRLDDNLKAINLRVETLERHTGERFSDLGNRLDADHSRTMLAITQLGDYYGLAKRVSAIEERGGPPEPRADH